MSKIYEIKDRKKLEKFIKKEGDYKIFKYKDFECRIIRPHYIVHHKTKRVENILHLCGYVALPREHKFFGINYQNELICELMVHGGITSTHDYILEKNNTYKKFTYLWWIGFDCAHGRDIFENSSLMAKIREKFKLAIKLKETYKTMHYVERELKNLVNQLLTNKKNNEK